MFKEVIENVAANANKYVWDIHHDRDSGDISIIGYHKTNRNKFDSAFSGRNHELAMKVENVFSGDKTCVWFLEQAALGYHESLDAFEKIVSHIKENNDTRDQEFLKKFIESNNEELKEAAPEDDSDIAIESVAEQSPST